MKIGRLSKRSDCSIQTIRFYEKEKLLAAPRRSEGNFRLYDESVLEQLLFIKRCRNLDLSLEEIRKLLTLSHSPDETCEQINKLIDEHIAEVDKRINEMKGLKSQLSLLQKSCSDNRTIEQCGILKNLSHNELR